jgi:hypothetical protein
MSAVATQAEPRTGAVARKPGLKLICATCRRPLVDFDGISYTHQNSRLDMPSYFEHHPAIPFLGDSEN